MSEPIQKFDVVIAGGGLNGLAMAVALAGPAVRIPLNVCIVDGADPRTFSKPQFDGRASAITASSRKMLEALGVWPALADHAEAMREIVITDSQGAADRRPALLHFGEEHAPGTPSAHMVENSYLYAALYDVVERSPHVEVRAGHTIGSYDFGKTLVTVGLSDGSQLRAELLIAADGRKSAARTCAGIETLGWSYPQAGITFTVEHDGDHEGRAEEHFLPAGPFAILPLTGRRSSIVWTEQSAFARELMEMDDDAFQACLLYTSDAADDRPRV